MLRVSGPQPFQMVPAASVGNGGDWVQSPALNGATRSTTGRPVRNSVTAARSPVVSGSPWMRMVPSLIDATTALGGITDMASTVGMSPSGGFT